jgi:hypothetical protein
MKPIVDQIVARPLRRVAGSESLSSSAFPPAGLAIVSSTRSVIALRLAIATFSLRAGISTFDLSRYMAPA